MPSTLNGYGSLQLNNLPLSVLQSQANGLIGTLVSVILQRIPRTKSARSCLPQDEQNKEIKKQQEEQPSSHSDKGSKRSTITTESRITDKVSKRRNTTMPPPHLRQGDPEHLQPIAGDEPVYRLGRSAHQNSPGWSQPRNHQWKSHVP